MDAAIAGLIAIECEKENDVNEDMKVRCGDCKEFCLVEDKESEQRQTACTIRHKFCFPTLTPRSGDSP
jgi:hypothetical protein